MITERTLRKWRREALTVDMMNKKHLIEPVLAAYATRILRMTQELLDQHLMRKETR